MASIPPTVHSWFSITFASMAPRSSMSSWTARPAAPPGRGGARRTGGARAGEFGQLRRAARPAGAFRQAQRRGALAAAHREVRDGGFRPLGAGPPSAAAPGARDKAGASSRPSSMWLAHYCCATGCILAPALSARPPGCRHGVTCARLPPARKPRRYPWRAVCRRFRRRTIRPARGGASRARSAATGLGRAVSLSRADLLNLAGILTPGPRLAALTGNRVLYRDDIRSRCWPPASRSSSKSSMPPASGTRKSAAARRSAGSAACLRCGAARAARSQVQAFRARDGRRLASRVPDAIQREGTRRGLAAPSMPLGELDGDALGAVDEDQLAGMKIHDLVARLESVRPELGDLGLDVADRKADVVHAELVQVADVRIGQGLGMAVAQQLDSARGETFSRTSVTCSASMPGTPM